MATALQIEDYWGDDSNPYQHNPGDTIAHMNLDYWEEQIKATLVTAAYLAVPVPSGNTAPVADDQAVFTDEDTAVPITLTASDGDGDPLTYAVVSQPAHGTLSGTPPDLIYTPDADYHGPDTLTFRAYDGLAYSSIATVSITVNSVNDAPVADDQAVFTDEDTAVAITLTAADVDEDSLTYDVVGLPVHGALSGTAPDLTYAPAADYHGPDTFTFRANDGLAYSSIATVSITVNSVNDAPVAEDQTVSAFQDRAVAITLTASDVDGDPLTYTVVSWPTHGALSGAPPDLTYTPALGYLGTEGFTFRADDGLADSNTANVTITVHMRFDLYLPVIWKG